MFLVIPLVEFLHVLGVDINVHHENPATLLCHISVSSVKRSRHRFASSLAPRSSRLEPTIDTRQQLGSHLSRHSPDSGASERDLPSHRGTPQRNSSFPANRSGCSPRGSGTRGFASFQAHPCLRRLSHLTL